MKTIIEQFYTSFQDLDAEKMVSFYHDAVVFEDPAFGKLHGEHAKNMWRMLCENAVDLSVGFSDVVAGSNKVTAHWEAQYTFSQTGKKVHNIINATFEFKDGKIIKHTDNFNLHKWAKQAMGFKGLLLGATIFFKKKLQEQTNKLLCEFEKNNGTIQ